MPAKPQAADSAAATSGNNLLYGVLAQRPFWAGCKPIGLVCFVERQLGRSILEVLIERQRLPCELDGVAEVSALGIGGGERSIVFSRGAWLRSALAFS